MTEPVFELTANAERNDGSVVPLCIRIFKPEYDAKQGYSCVGECEFLREEPYVLSGADENHAVENAYLFIRTEVMKQAVRLTNDENEVVELPVLAVTNVPEMTPLSREFYRFEANAENRDGKIAPLSIWISHPDFDDARGYYCLLICSFVRLKPFFIFGVDEKHACEQAFEFIRKLVQEKSERLLDSEGNEIALDEDVPFKS